MRKKARGARISWKDHGTYLYFRPLAAISIIRASGPFVIIWLMEGLGSRRPAISPVARPVRAEPGLEVRCPAAWCPVRPLSS